MADQLPIISGTHAVNATATASTSLIGRGLSAIQRKETGLARPELDTRYRQARDIYNRITDYGWDRRFSSDVKPNQRGQIDLIEVIQSLQLQPFFDMLQQLTDVFTVFRQLADQGYGKAYFPFSNMYWGGQGISKNIEKAGYYSHLAFDWCFANQALNDPEIWMDLADLYEFGVGVESDDEQSVFWYRKAAEQGDVYAQSHLGLLMSGSCVEEEFKQATFWCRKAAEQGLAAAQCELGEMYEYDQGVEQDDEQAVFWYRKAAEQGHAKAQHNLGWMYQIGRGLEQDDEQAVFWYRKAAEQGYARAQGNLGWMYEFGRGLEQEDEQAVFWYGEASEQGNTQAQNILHAVKFSVFLK